MFYRDSIKIVDYLDGFQTEARGSRIPVGALATQLSNNEQYAGGELNFFPHPEGYVKVTPTYSRPGDMGYAFNYVFNYTDHLGNVRLSYSKDPRTNQLKILEENHYYPFGLKHSVYSAGRLKDFEVDSSNPEEEQVFLTPVTKTEYQYKYNGQEWQDELGLNMYAMDLRQYDPAIGRWVAQDPVTHFDYSPYSAFDNNPVFWADPSGADAVDIGYDRIIDSQDMMGSYHWSGGFQEVENEGVDDIRFRDENGKLIATYYTDVIDDDVYLPVNIKNGEGNLNINELLEKAGIKIDDVDIVGVGGMWDFTFVMGGGKGMEFIYFLDGEAKGTWQSYVVSRGNVGLNGSLGAYGIVGDYYNDRTLTAESYTGTSFSVSAGIKGLWISSYGKFWAPRNIENDKLGLKSGFNADLRSWSGYTVGGGFGAGAQWSKQNTKIYGN